MQSIFINLIEKYGLLHYMYGLIFFQFIASYIYLYKIIQSKDRMLKKVYIKLFICSQVLILIIIVILLFMSE